MSVCFPCKIKIKKHCSLQSRGWLQVWFYPSSSSSSSTYGRLWWDSDKFSSLPKASLSPTMVAAVSTIFFKGRTEIPCLYQCHVMSTLVQQGHKTSPNFICYMLVTWLWCNQSNLRCDVYGIQGGTPRFIFLSFSTLLYFFTVPNCPDLNPFKDNTRNSFIQTHDVLLPVSTLNPSNQHPNLAGTVQTT